MSPSQNRNRGVPETIHLTEGASMRRWSRPGGPRWSTSGLSGAVHVGLFYAVGAFYGLFGLGLALYFTSQGGGRLLWPLLANLVRLVIAGGGGWLALRWSADVSYVFAALGAALAAFGLITAGAVATGAWFGPIVWPRPRVLAREGGQCK